MSNIEYDVRMNGDGLLLPCPCCASVAECFDGRDLTIEGYQVLCTNRKCGLETGLFPTMPMARRAWNTRATPQQSGNSGEDTLTSDGLCPVPPAKTSAVSTQTACETEGVSSDLSAAAHRMSDGVGSLALVIATSQCENGVSPGPSETATPKPAPDGDVQPDYEAAARALGFEQLPSGTWYHPNQHPNFTERFKTAEDIFERYFGKHWLASPAPDAVLSTFCASSGESYCASIRVFERCPQCPFRLGRGSESARAAPVPSPDGAGTGLIPSGRLAHKISGGTLFLRLPDPPRPSTELKDAEKQMIVEALRVTPPVRGDREAIARLLAIHHPGAFEDQEADPVTHGWKNPDLTPNEQAYGIADAILSLSVQPSAGEREALEDIARQKTIPELIEDGNEVGDLEYAYNTIIARARSGLSRQPQSNSEGERRPPQGNEVPSNG